MPVSCVVVDWLPGGELRDSLQAGSSIVFIPFFSLPSSSPYMVLVLELQVGILFFQGWLTLCCSGLELIV